MDLLEGTGEVAKTVAITAVDVTATVIREAADEGSATAANTPGLPAVLTSTATTPISVLPIR